MLYSQILAFTLAAIAASASSDFNHRQHHHQRLAAERRAEKEIRQTVSFNYGSANVGGRNVVRGVNLGGWLVLERWIYPSVFEQSGVADSVADEWSLTAALGKSKARTVLQQHWSSFYSQADFTEMAAYGLNHVRIPIGYWAINPLSYEPYVTGQLAYLKQAVYWAKNAGLKVIIDLHGHPGSQNGQDNSGLAGNTMWASNTTNLDRSLYALKNLTAEFTQDTYGGTVTVIEVINEARTGQSPGYDMAYLKNYYSQATSAVQAAASGSVKIMIADAWLSESTWKNYDPLNSGATSPPSYLLIDSHQYFCFDQLTGELTHAQILTDLCTAAKTLGYQGSAPVIVGEWGLKSSDAYGQSQSSSQLSQTYRTWMTQFFEAQIQAYEQAAGWIFWCWKTEYQIPEWDYQEGVKRGWIPKNVGDTSQRHYPVSSNGCIDTSASYTAPATLPSLT